MKLIVDNIDTQIVYEEADKHLKPVIDKELHVGIGIKDEDAKYSRLYRNGIWDGIVKFYDEENSRFPSGLVDQVDTILGHLQNKFPFQYTIVDDRPDVFLTLEDVDEEIVLDDEEVGTITLRDYQYESVKSAVEDQVGIVNVATNGGKCVIKSTRILGSKGIQKISMLFNTDDIGGDIKEIPYTGDTSLVNRYGELERPSHLTTNGVRHVNEVLTDKGYREVTTDNHPYLTVAPTGEHVWKSTEDLVEGDWVVSRKGDNIYGGAEVDSKEARLAGMLIADGYLAQEQRTEFTNDQEELLAFTEGLFKRYGNTYRRTREGTKGIYIYLSDIIGNKKLHEDLDLGYAKSKDKRVPERILGATREAQLAFLSGYLECEMSIETPKCAIEVTSASRELLEEIQFMLLNMGYVSNLSEKKVKGYEDNWYGRLTLGAIESKRLLEELTFLTKQRNKQVDRFNKAYESRARNPKGQTTPYGKEIVKLYKDTYPNPPKGMKKAFDFPKTISIVRLRELYEMYPDGLPEYKAILDTLLSEEFVYSQVVSVTDAGHEETYDVHMPETHSFIAQGMINHNTEIASGFIQQIRPYLERGETIAFFTSSTAIFNQSAVRLSERLGGLPIGKYGGGKKDIKQVNVVMIPTISTALKVDPEANLKFSPKEMIIKKLAKLSPQFQKGVNQKRMLEAYLRNFQVITQADSRYAMEIQMILDTCGTDSQVKMKLRNYEAEYQKLIEKKNGDVLKKYNEAKEFLESVAVMIVDEAHHTSSDTWYTSLRMCTNARYRLALTGSIDKRNKVLWQRMQAVFHDTVIKTSNEELINLGHSAKPTITMVPIGAPRGIEGKKDYQEVYRLGIVENEYRNSIITGVTAKKYREGKGVLVIVNYVEHGEMLSEQLDKMQVDHFFLHGELPVEEREEKLQDMREGRLKVLIATSLVDEGVDISGIDALVLGAGGKSMRQVLQRVGRALRKKKQGENVTHIYDFDDRTHEYLRKHTKERRNIYLAENFDVVDLNV